MLKFISSIGLALTLAELKQRVRRLVTRGILGAVGGVFFLFGFCFLLVAAHLYLSSLLNPIASAAIIGGVLIFIALILFLAARSKGGSAPRAAKPVHERAEENMERLGERLGSTPLANPTLIVAALGLLVGFLFARRGKSDD